jgi:hypothetical protein
MSWSKRFEPPIPLPGGGSLVTLRDAANFIERLPPTEQQHPKVQTAIHVLLQAVDHGGPVIFARMGVTAMLGRHDPPKPTRPPKRRR